MGFFQGKMKIWSIVAIVLLVVVGVTCLALGLTLSGAKYYTLSYEEFDGVTYVSDVMSGAKVKDGTEIRFMVELDEQKVTGEPVVKVNGDAVLTADGDGVYSFVMKKDTTVRVDNISAIDSFRVTFDEGEFRTRYKSEQGDALQDIVVNAGDEVRFDVITSVYYVGEYTVCANTTVLEPDADGLYTVAVTENLNITVAGLTEDTPFYLRDNGGYGTESNPYKLSRPYDLFTVAKLIADGFYTDLKFAYYELTADIDMKGEQLYVIGDYTTEESFFAGHFFGNNHKISNFYIEDFVIEQTAFTEVKLPYVGLFGIVSATEYAGPAEISGVHLENFEIKSDHTGERDNMCTIGGIAGYAAGANIVGCSVNGAITVKGSEEIVEIEPDEDSEDTESSWFIPFTYVGGIVGIMQSASTNGNEFYASVRSCASEVDIISEGGYVQCIGGIVGSLNSASEKNSSAVLNCYSTGNMWNAIYTGGIVGYAAQYSSVQNCYSLGEVSAFSSVDIMNRNTDVYGTSYAGGLVGYLASGGAIANCFTKGGVRATSVNSGSKYAVSGKVVGHAVKAGESNLHDAGAYAYNCYFGSEAVNEEFCKASLKWESADWTFGAGYPTLNFDEAHIEYTVTVNFVEAGEDGRKQQGAYSMNAKDVYLSMSFWSYVNEGGLPEFHDGWNGLRSYGYFFDEGLTIKVPYSYVPTGNTTLYAGFADYSEVAGVYYFNSTAEIIDINIELTLDGKLLFKDGARSYESFYTYDGNIVRLYDNYLFAEMLYGEGVLTTFVGEGMDKEGSHALKIDDIYLRAYPMSLTAVQEVEDLALVYGTYYEDEASFAFYKNGTVVISGTASDGIYNYYISEDDGDSLLIVSASGDSIATATLEGGVVTEISGLSLNTQKLDEFAGEWEMPISALIQFVFDGKGEWKFEYFGYDEEGKKLSGNHAIAEGTYTVSNGVATLYSGGGQLYNTAAIENGFLVLGGEEYVADGSFAGVWIFNSKNPVEITLEGITNLGYGNAIVNYGGSVGEVEATYHTRDGKVCLFIENLEICELEYVVSKKTLVGSLLMLGTGDVNENATFCLYDSFKGVWVSEDSALSIVEFNGLGVYNLSGTEDYLAVKGNIKINGENVGAYYLSKSQLSGEFMLKGSFTYNNAEYTLEYDYLTNKVTINDVTLVARDSMCEVTLLDESGNTYDFDGKGLLGVGGTLSVNGTATYNYKIVGSVIELSDLQSGDASGSIALDTYILTLGGAQGVELFVNGDFEGSWLVGGTMGDTMTIGKVGGNNKAYGKYNDENVEYVYNAASGTLSFVLENGLTVYAKANKVEEGGKWITELSLTADDATLICMRSGAGAYLDKYKGEYVGENKMIVLDGFMNSHFGGGTAIVFEDGELALTISYQIDAYGHIVFVEVGVTYFIFVERVDGEYKLGSKSYDLVTPDKMYKTLVYGVNSLGELDENVTYTFDGIDGVYDKNGKRVYTYVLKEESEEDKLNLELRLVFTSVTNGKRYSVVLNYGSTDYFVSLTEILEEN